MPESGITLLPFTKIPPLNCHITNFFSYVMYFLLFLKTDTYTHNHNISTIDCWAELFNAILKLFSAKKVPPNFFQRRKTGIFFHELSRTQTLTL